jgi:hypothetical protein
MVFAINAWYSPQQLRYLLIVAANTVNDDVCTGMLHGL